MNQTTEQVLTAFVGLVVVVLYIIMVVDGVKVARQKGRSPHWMWFALHPLGGFIAWICLRVAAPVRACPRCTRRVPKWAQVCPGCGYEFSESATLKHTSTHSDKATPPDMVTQQILELKRMLDLGLITQSEFDEKKTQLLSKM